MDPTTWPLFAVLAACAFLILCALLLGSRLRTGEFSVFGLFTGKVTGRGGATVSRGRITGDENTMSAKGGDATVDRSGIKGKGNRISAES